MNYYVYYCKHKNGGEHDDVAICEAASVDDAVVKFREFYNVVSEEDVRKIDLHRDGYVPGIMIVSDY